MKFIKPVFIATLLFMLAFFSNCSKSDSGSVALPPAPDTKLQVTVTDKNGSIISGATVNLYLSQNDLINQINCQGTGITDATGNLIFHNLLAVKYSLIAISGCENNFNNGINLLNPLTLNGTTTTTAMVSETGTLKYVNTTANPYTIYVNGTATLTVNGNTTGESTFAPTGSYTIRVLQQSGYTVYPTDETFTGNLVCGGTLTTTFP